MASNPPSTPFDDQFQLALLDLSTAKHKIEGIHKLKCEHLGVPYTPYFSEGEKDPLSVRESLVIAWASLLGFVALTAMLSGARQRLLV